MINQNCCFIRERFFIEHPNLKKCLILLIQRNNQKELICVYKYLLTQTHFIFHLEIIWAMRLENMEGLVILFHQNLVQRLGWIFAML